MKPLGTRVVPDRVQDDTDAFRQLHQESLMDLAEQVEGAQFNHRLDLPLEKHRQHHDVQWRSVAQPGGDLDIVSRYVGQRDPLLFKGALPYQTFPNIPFVWQVIAPLVTVTG